MTFGIADVQRNWGPNGVEIIEDLVQFHGPEHLPDPVKGERLPDYLTRIARSGLCAVRGDMHVLQDVQAFKKAEARGLPVYDIDGIEPDNGDANAGLDERWKGLSAADKFESYQRDKNTLPGTVVPDFEEE
ncbi:MAG TPA: hypothetical protein VEM14_03300 [Gemmatimonadaceae bacterium]|nr:hypothetical protein [Gemmatimonadaceae bacterium]